MHTYVLLCMLYFVFKWLLGWVYLPAFLVYWVIGFGILAGFFFFCFLSFFLSFFAFCYFECLVWSCADHGFYGLISGRWDGGSVYAIVVYSVRVDVTSKENWKVEDY